MGKYNKSVPWDDRQKISVDGRLLAYHAHKDEGWANWRVLFACGESATARELRDAGCKVVPPTHPRYLEA